MQLIHHPDHPRPSDWRQPVLAIGNFDGFHLGHQRIVARVTQRASELGATPVVMTFDPHPTRVVRPDRAPSLLMTPAQKFEALEHAGIRGAAILRFTPEVASWAPETFVRTVLADWLGVSEVWVGASFVFGHQRSGTFAVLHDLAGRHRFRAEKIDPVRHEDAVVSSTRIRRLIGEGRVDEAAALLGRNYFVDGTVVHGLQRGRTLGFPTANLDSENEVVPPDGVYASIATLDGIAYPSVTNIGVRPTFHQPSAVVIETHLLDVDRDLYGRRLRVSFVRRIREERTFDGIEALKFQISADCERARALFRSILPCGSTTR